jgi:hypothetical protein
MIRESHGIADARRVETAVMEGKELQGITVIDGADGLVILDKTSNSPAGLTPEQARLLARMLNASAARAEKVSTHDDAGHK